MGLGHGGACTIAVAVVSRRAVSAGRRCSHGGGGILGLRRVLRLRHVLRLCLVLRCHLRRRCRLLRLYRRLRVLKAYGATRWRPTWWRANRHAGAQARVMALVSESVGIMRLLRELVPPASAEGVNAAKDR